MFASTGRRRDGRTSRNPRRPREALLHAAFRNVHESGFQGADLDSILQDAGVTKGALYHHFESKKALGYAIVEEVLMAITRDKWLIPLRRALNPFDALVKEVVESTSLRPEYVQGGCPLNNLSQEMSPLHAGFRQRLAKVFADWQGGIAAALRDGRNRGLVRRDVDPVEEAAFLVALYEGYISLAKNAQHPRVLQAGKRWIVRYLESLRAGGPGQRGGPLVARRTCQLVCVSMEA